MDRRIRKTEQAFTQALIQLLNEKALNRITVKDLCEYADLNRSTFYLHYYDINDLIDKTEQQMVDSVFIPVDNTGDGMISGILNTFEYIKKHKTAYKLFLNVNRGSGLIRKLTVRLTEQLTPRIKEMLPDCSDSLARLAAIIHVGGATALLYDWVVNNDCQIPAIAIIRTVSDMTDIMYREKQSVNDIISTATNGTNIANDPSA